MHKIASVKTRESQEEPKTFCVMPEDEPVVKNSLVIKPNPLASRSTSFARTDLESYRRSLNRPERSLVILGKAMAWGQFALSPDKLCSDKKPSREPTKRPCAKQSDRPPTSKHSSRQIPAAKTVSASLTPCAVGDLRSRRIAVPIGVLLHRFQAGGGVAGCRRRPNRWSKAAQDI